MRAGTRHDAMSDERYLKGPYGQWKYAPWAFHIYAAFFVLLFLTYAVWPIDLEWLSYFPEALIVVVISIGGALIFGVRRARRPSVRGNLRRADANPKSRQPLPR